MGRRVTLWGVVVNLLLAGGKIASGVFFGSQAVLADGVHSLTDLVSDLAVLASLQMGDRPADDCHPYGHRRIHTLVALFVGMALLAAGGGIAYQAVRSMLAPPEILRGGVPLAMSLLTIPLKEWLFRVTHRVAVQVRNPALEANAWHHRSDAVTSLAASLGLAGAMFLGPGWAFLDGLTAAVLSAFLMVAAFRIIRSSAAELVDRSPAEAQMQRISRIVSDTPGVQHYHAVRARKLGEMVEMDVHVEVDPEMSVQDGHAIASDVRRRIRAEEPDVTEVIVHVEPHQPQPKEES